jgi:hypothetical protein
MAMTPEDIRALVHQLSSLGEPEVRRLLPLEHWGKPGSELRARVEDWLRSLEVEREVASVSTAAEALRLARVQRTIAIIAIIMAAIALALITINIIK